MSASSISQSVSQSLFNLDNECRSREKHEHAHSTNMIQSSSGAGSIALEEPMLQQVFGMAPKQEHAS